ncbi:X Translin-associated factor [Triplophysa tibetana]|uniref:X Translin-associated factor n=1 Tax=Triplophysa tibetana TaxID=1572043 RepID=A0A5A9PBT7_9TELE|nr:X Translin-associated factor [Triplophysa tibetana]
MSKREVEKINEPDLVLCIGLFDSVPDFENILNDADVKLDGVRQKIGQIPEELRGEDLHQFHRAFTPGIQEYVEAVSFHHFIRHRKLIILEEINARLVFMKEDQTTKMRCTVRHMHSQPHMRTRHMHSRPRTCRSKMLCKRLKKNFW